MQYRLDHSVMFDINQYTQEMTPRNTTLIHTTCIHVPDSFRSAWGATRDADEC